MGKKKVPHKIKSKSISEQSGLKAAMLEIKVVAL